MGNQKHRSRLGHDRSEVVYVCACIPVACILNTPKHRRCSRVLPTRKGMATVKLATLVIRVSPYHLGRSKSQGSQVTHPQSSWRR